MSYNPSGNGSRHAPPGAAPAAPGRGLAVERVYEALRERVIRGELLPGMHLVEAELTAEHGVSRVTVRDALRRLAADELVELIPHRGVRVRRLTPRDVEELYVAREAIECVAARLAANGPREILAELREIHDEARALTPGRDQVRLTRLTVRFHQTIARMSGNRMLHAILVRLNTQMIGYQLLSSVDAGCIAAAHRDHAAILAALARRDGARAEHAMRAHIAGTRDALTQAIAPGAVAQDPRAKATRTPRQTAGRKGRQRWE